MQSLVIRSCELSEFSKINFNISLFFFLYSLVSLLSLLDLAKDMTVTRSQSVTNLLEDLSHTLE